MKDSQTLYAEKKVWEAIYTIKKVLAQPKPTEEPEREWVGLTDEETETLVHRFKGDPWTLIEEVSARLEKRNT